jgi:hypothetical protein
MASRSMRESEVDPSHLAKTYRNIICRSQTPKTLVVYDPFLPIVVPALVSQWDIHIDMCVI